MTTPNDATRISNVHKPSISSFQKYAADIEYLFSEYGNELVPRIIEYEAEECEYPVEILNEIRAIYSHLYRASVAENDEKVLSNILKAKSHSKRAVLDGYKYLCMAYNDRYDEFFSRYKYIDWNKSGFQTDISSLSAKREKAVSLLRSAKELESTAKSEADINEYRELYYEAYIGYRELIDALNDIDQKVMDSPNIRSHSSSMLMVITGIVCTILGLLIGIII